MSRSRKLPQTHKPVWKGPIEGYVVNFITANLWRVQATHERADVLQEAWLVFERCARKYPDVDTPQHFMALFKRAWYHEFVDLANRDTATRKLFLPITENRDEDGERMELREPVGESDNDGALATMIRQAPSEIALVMQMFLNCPTELLELALSSWNPDGVHRNQGSERINKLLGFAEDYDSVGAVRSYFSPELAAA